MIWQIYARAQENPGKIALVHGNTPLTYGSFARVIDATRQYLGSQNLPKTGIAVVATESRLGAWVLGLALRSLGLTTIEIPPKTAVDRLQLTDVRCVVTTETRPRGDLEALCAAGKCRLIRVPDAVRTQSAAGPVPNPLNDSSTVGGHILLTSGTTGAPKKILVSADYRRQQSAFRRRILGIAGNSVMVSSFPGWTSNNYFYQSCIWDAGATVVISDILDALRYLRVTHLRVVPATLVNILSAPPDALQRNDALRVFVGGAPLSKQLAKQAKQRLTRHIFTQIGSTEASPITLTPVEGPDDLRWHRLIPEREVQILDEYDRVLPAGQVGRVRIRLQDGAPEYLDDPEANRIFFRSGYFYPGDLGVIGPDGRFALRGRVAEIINVQGMKLASGPIEEMLRDRFNVSGVCVFSGPDATGDEIVYVVIESRKLIKPADVETTLRTIPAPKFAVQLYQVEALPRNHMGKIQYSVVKKRLGIS